jgi:hypothetical protein
VVPKTARCSTSRQRSRQIRGRWFAALLLGTSILAAVCATSSAIPAQAPSVTISRLTDEPSGLDTSPKVEFLAAYELSSRDPRFGGFSAIETDGRTLWLLSDRATLWQAAITLEPRTGGLLLEDWRVGALVPDQLDRRPLDSEALALVADGTLVAAFEHDASLRRLRPEPNGDWSTERLHAGRLLEGSPPNAGLEALALLPAGAPDGTLVALSEGARLGPNIAAGALLSDDARRSLGYRVADGFSPVGAAALDGWLYVLERSVGLLAGWQSRLTRAVLPTSADRQTLEGEALLRIGVGPFAENYEGVALARGADGAVTLLLIADDNQSALQRTLLLVFAYAG